MSFTRDLIGGAKSVRVAIKFIILHPAVEQEWLTIIVTS